MSNLFVVKCLSLGPSVIPSKGMAHSLTEDPPAAARIPVPIVLFLPFRCNALFSIPVLTILPVVIPAL